MNEDAGRSARDHAAPTEDVPRDAALDETRTADASSIKETSLPPGTRRAPAPLRTCDRERYDMLREHGRGGIGVVTQAHDRELGRDVAVKELQARGHAAELRFLREALITSRLEHPGIVPVHEAGRWPDGTPFYTMKLVGGRSLQARLLEATSLDERLAYLPNLIAVADAISYAHDRGVVHRDLKPANVMIGDFGETIVIDWGLSKVIEEADSRIDEDSPYRRVAGDDLTAAGSVLGTPAYMAPEQLGGHADHRADIYALGGILHQLLTGQPPHVRGRDGAGTEGGLAYPRKAPIDLVAVALRALARGRDDRYQTTRAFADDLKAYTRRDRVTARHYSLSARLALVFARHRAISTVATAALILILVMFGVSLINIRAERAEAIDAREVAVVNGAAAMMERDPTRAWKALQGIPAASVPALLRARIAAAGVADRTITLPGRFDDEHVLHDGATVVLSTGERTLHVLDTRTGALRQLADGLTEPAVWAATENRVYFVRGSSHLAIAEVPLTGGPVIEVAPLAKLPPYIFANERGVYWLEPDSTVHLAAVNRAPEIEMRNVQAFMVVGSDLVACRQQQLVVGTDGDASRPVGPCAAHAAWAKTDSGFAHASADTLYISLYGQVHSLPIAGGDGVRYMQLTRSGMIVGTNESGQGLVLRAGSNVVEHVALASTPQTVAAHGNLAAWGFLNGSIEIFDVVDGRHWVIRSTPGMLWCLAFLSDQRLMTCDRSEIRLWTLPPSAPQIVTTLPTTANNVAFDPMRGAAFDGSDGRAWLVGRGSTEARLVHRHEGLGYGIAWCDGEVCSTGWDGRVLCTNVETNTVRTIVDLRSVTPWIASGGGHCFAAAANGGVIDLRIPGRLAYSHQHEPYRLAVSPDGRYVASGDWGGDVIVFDVTRLEIVAMKSGAHAGRVTNVAWSEGSLVTSGVDGRVRLWSAELDELRTWTMNAAVRYLDTGSETIGVTCDDGSVWLLSTQTAALPHVDLGGVVSAAAAAPDGAMFAAGTSDGEVVVLDAAGRAAAVRFGDGRISCLGFEDAQTLFACTSAGRIMRVPLAAMRFQ